MRPFARTRSSATTASEAGAEIRDPGAGADVRRPGLCGLNGEVVEGQLAFDAGGLRHGEEGRQGLFGNVLHRTLDCQQGGDGGRITKFHAQTDVGGCPGTLSLTPGNVRNVTIAVAALAAAPNRMRAPALGSGHDTVWLCADQRKSRITPNIPGARCRKRTVRHDGPCSRERLRPPSAESGTAAASQPAPTSSHTRTLRPSLRLPTSPSEADRDQPLTGPRSVQPTVRRVGWDHLVVPGGPGGSLAVAA